MQIIRTMATTYTPMDIRVSDGKPVYPTNLTKTPGAGGSYDYYREVEENDSKSVLWRTKAARNIIEEFGDKNGESLPSVVWAPCGFRLVVVLTLCCSSGQEWTIYTQELARALQVV